MDELISACNTSSSSTPRKTFIASTFVAEAGSYIMDIGIGALRMDTQVVKNRNCRVETTLGVVSRITSARELRRGFGIGLGFSLCAAPS